jgi:hypothetical protein
VSELEEGIVQVSLPHGPALDRLRDEATARVALSEALSKVLARPVSLEVMASGEGHGGVVKKRITQETVREERLKELIRQEPLLERAVEELDLELLD